jgi:hypothetical protein
MDEPTTRARAQDIDEDERLREEQERRDRQLDDPLAPEQLPEADEFPDEADFEEPTGDELGAAVTLALLDHI